MKNIRFKIKCKQCNLEYDFGVNSIDKVYNQEEIERQLVYLESKYELICPNCQSGENIELKIKK